MNDDTTAAGIFRRHHESLHGFLSRATGQPALADDLCQETFLRVARSTDAYEDRGLERAWVFRTARNVLANHWRDTARRPRVVADLHAADAPAPALTELRFDLDRALASLPEPDREAFLLREVGGLGYEEIAATCDLTPDAVRNRIHRARIGLRAFLRPAGHPPAELRKA